MVRESLSYVNHKGYQIVACNFSDFYITGMPLKGLAIKDVTTFYSFLPHPHPIPYVNSQKW